MLDLLLWVATVIDPRLGLAICAGSFFVDSLEKPVENARTFVDRSCQTDPEKNGQELEGELSDSFEDMEQEGVPWVPVQNKTTFRKRISPYIWRYSLWPSEGGV